MTPDFAGSTRRAHPPAHWYVRLMRKVGGLWLIDRMDEGERATTLESFTVGFNLSNYGFYLWAILMVWFGPRSAVYWSMLGILIPALTATLAGLYGWVKRSQMPGVGHLPVSSQMLSGLPIFFGCLMWLAGFLLRSNEWSFQGMLIVFGTAAVLMVVTTFVLIRAGQQEQQRHDETETEADDEF